LQYRTIWISDVHLGTPGSSADKLLDFLRDNDSDRLYLVGDIIDGWQLKKKFFWNQSHSDFIQKILRKARKGTEVIYIPGNHDEAAREYVGCSFENISIHLNHTHVTADGKRLIVMHGDEFDMVINHHKWVAHIGDFLYNFMIKLNRYYQAYRNWRGLPYWSLSSFAKRKVKGAVNFIGNFEKTVSEYARANHFDGVVCGHIHFAEIREIDGFIYANDGDWVESCTALVEHFDGRLEIIRYMEQ
jgi:UDP-2,3-diacylglucosamine pyrophosphatase LpxH